MVGITWTVQSVLVKPKKNEEAFQFTEIDEFEGEDNDTDDEGSVASSTTGEHLKRKRESDDEGRDEGHDEGHQGPVDLENENLNFD